MTLFQDPLPVTAQNFKEALSTLKNAADAVPPLSEKFATLTLSQPLATASFEAESQKQAMQIYARERLISLSEARAERALEEMNASLDLALATLDYLYKLHSLEGLDADDHKRRLGLIEIHENRMVYFLQEGPKILPSRFWHENPEQNEKLQKILERQKMLYAQFAQYKDITGQGKKISSPNDDGPMLFRLGTLSSKITELSCARVRTAFDFIEWINEALIPYGVDDGNIWMEQKLLMLQECSDALIPLSDHLKASRAYLMEAASKAGFLNQLSDRYFGDSDVIVTSLTWLSR